MHKTLGAVAAAAILMVASSAGATGRSENPGIHKRAAAAPQQDLSARRRYHRRYYVRRYYRPRYYYYRAPYYAYPYPYYPYPYYRYYGPYVGVGPWGFGFGW
jgi:hypothetical protein